MRMLTLVLLLSSAVSPVLTGQDPPANPAPRPAPQRPSPGPPVAIAPTIRPVGTMKELMAHLIKPTSDAVFYIGSRTPTSDEGWLTLQAQTLTLAESANLLLLPAHVRGRKQWIADTQLMLDAGTKAFAAAKAKDVAALEALNDALYESCVTCHEHFRPGYGKRPGN